MSQARLLPGLIPERNAQSHHAQRQFSLFEQTYQPCGGRLRRIAIVFRMLRKCLIPQAKRTLPPAFACGLLGRLRCCDLGRGNRRRRCGQRFLDCRHSVRCRGNFDFFHNRCGMALGRWLCGERPDRRGRRIRSHAGRIEVGADVFVRVVGLRSAVFERIVFIGARIGVTAFKVRSVVDAEGLTVALTASTPAAAALAATAFPRRALCQLTLRLRTLQLRTVAVRLERHVDRRCAVHFACRRRGVLAFAKMLRGD